MRTVTRFSSAGVGVVEYLCDSGPGDAPFAECHPIFTLSFVRAGGFGYRRSAHAFELVPGSVLVGHAGDEYVCTHEHVHGDDCLSFQFSDEALDQVRPSRALRATAVVPPVSELMVPAELAQAAINGGSDLGLDEVAWIFLDRVKGVISGARPEQTAPAGPDRRRAVRTALWIEANSGEPITLAAAAHEAGLSPFHFLRVFSRTLGVTPHQYLVRSRVRRAARLLADGDRPIIDVAMAAGFSDLSNFVRTFRRAAGRSPRAFRRSAQLRRAGRDRNFLQDRPAASV